MKGARTYRRPVLMLVMWRMYASAAIMTALIVWIAIAPPKDWTIPLTIAGLCIGSRFAMKYYLRMLERRGELFEDSPAETLPQS